MPFLVGTLSGVKGKTIGSHLFFGRAIYYRGILGKTHVSPRECIHSTATCASGQMDPESELDAGQRSDGPDGDQMANA